MHYRLSPGSLFFPAHPRPPRAWVRPPPMLAMYSFWSRTVICKSMIIGCHTVTYINFQPNSKVAGHVLLLKNNPYTCTLYNIPLVSKDLPFPQTSLLSQTVRLQNSYKDLSKVMLHVLIFTYGEVCELHRYWHVQWLANCRVYSRNNIWSGQLLWSWLGNS